MAEGIEESENNNSNNSSGEQRVMLGAVMPCEMTSPNLGGLKRELEIVPATAATASSPGATTPTLQNHPINLKSEEIDHDSDSRSNSPARPISRLSIVDEYPNNLHETNDQHMTEKTISPSNQQTQHQQSEHTKNVNAAAAAAQAHFNGTMQGMLSLQKLQQNIASMQIPSLSGLQGLASLAATSPNPLGSPLNLSVGAAPTLPCPSTGPGNGLNLNSNQMPQLILASGQLVQGIQGAQLLIPTSQGIATQTILTIPVSQQVNTNEQLVQSLNAINGQNSNLGNLHANQPNLLSPHLLSSSVQQLLAAVQPQLFGSNQQNQHSQSTQGQTHPSQSTTSSQSSHIPQASSPLSSSSHLAHSRVQTPKSSPPRNASASSISSLGSQHHERHNPYDKIPSTTSTTTSQSHSIANYTTNGHSHLSSSPNSLHHHHEQRHHSHHHHNITSRSHSPTSLAISNINRLAATNGEITITKSSPGLGSSSSNSSHPNGPHLVPQIKLSPSSMQMSPTGSDCSKNDFLDDNPNEPTINQTNCNVVDGIDLDEIKEFAKAFKLRRLGLGLTQTQVGQALSVTEGPAYSQSAICSALAAQMYAAQLSSQQQAMFEKLDITPKSAQKIKPVLERWMQEAEERYKSGPNHLTEFIGVEPSKKRKRRTSFTPQALELLNAHFERNTHPSGTEITGLAHQLGYEREVIRIWFCNKRQALKNTVRMMSKGMV